MNATNGLHIRLTLARPDFELQVDLALPSTGISVLFGPSGSGKTSLLRCVAGLERPTVGRVSVGGELWQDDATGVFRPPWTRDLGYVFQEASLFAHLDVQGNVEFGLQRARRTGSAAALARAIDLLGIGPLMHRSPTHLSGGERQRVAIARALATQPRLLLLDEPLAALDPARRQEILPWLEKMRDELHIPMLYVTHSAEELARLADFVVSLDAGKVKVAGPTHLVLSQTDSRIIVGDEAGVVLKATVAERDLPWHLAKVAFAGGVLWVRDTGMALGQSVRLRILARDVSLSVQAAQDSSIQNHIAGQIESIADDAHPSQALVRVRCGDSCVVSRVTRRALSALNLSQGTQVWVQVKSVAVMS
ncbi:MAG: molybdenum ABC transporter ATP-binding protein [Rhodoferax sp.]|nr:molybdenum ABC transporter ATP-binding protein [Rhodoferax sp.]